MSVSGDAAVAQLQSLYPQILQGVLTACQGNVERAAGVLVQMMNESTKPKSQPKAQAAAAAAGGVPPLPDGSARSTAELYGAGSSTCGYCHGPRKSSSTYGVVCEQLSVADYQTLIDLGWRRSGDYLYKQRNAESCCCHYTIRLNVHKYTRSKAQRQAINRFERFLRGEAVGAAAAAEDDEPMADAPTSAAASTSKPHSASDPHVERIQQALLAAVQALVAAGKLPASLVPDTYTKQLRVYPYAEPAAKKGSKKDGAVNAAGVTVAAPTATAQHPPFQYSSNLALVLSGLLRKQKQDVSSVSIAQIISQQIGDGDANASADPSPAQPIQSFVAEPLGYLNFHIDGAQPARKRSVSQTNVAKAANAAAAAAATATATATSANTPAAAASSASTPVAHKFEIRQVPAEFDPQAFEVYKKYQMTVHGDKESKLTPSSYTRFLCSSPLVRTGPYGGFHHHYLLDGRLIAVGVVDILPRCLSSVYLFYDPAFEHLNLGTVTAVKEIEWIQQRLTPQHPELNNYYMGYYIHSCVKMRYKAKFAPSDLLCPLRFTWHPLAACVPALDSLQAALPPSQTGTGRCVILSDVAPESREEDGSVPQYSAPSMVQRLESDAAATPAADANKKKRKKKKKKTKTAAGASATTGTAEGDGGEEEEAEEEENDDESRQAPAAVSASVTAAAPAASASATAAAAPSSTASNSKIGKPAAGTSGASTARASSQPAPRVSVSASSPYVYDSAAAQAVGKQRAAMAQACVGGIPLLIQKRLLTLDQLTAAGQRQVRAPLLDWATLVGTEVAHRVAVKFG